MSTNGDPMVVNIYSSLLYRGRSISERANILAKSGSFVNKSLVIQSVPPEVEKDSKDLAVSSDPTKDDSAVKDADFKDSSTAKVPESKDESNSPKRTKLQDSNSFKELEREEQLASGVADTSEEKESSSESESASDVGPSSDSSSDSDPSVESSVQLSTDDTANMSKLLESLNVRRVETNGGEVWVFFEDEVNLNDVLEPTIDYVAKQFEYLTFSRLARKSNAIVFDKR